MIYVVAMILWAPCLIHGARTCGPLSYRFDGYAALGSGFLLTSSVASHASAAAGINAATGAYHLWRWWKGGGGDDTKRRLKDFASKFEGVRRTAPQAG